MSILTKPYELSLWRDKIEQVEGTGTSSTIDGVTQYYNLYKGLDTSPDDLSFWYTTRKWDDISFDKVTGKPGVVLINMKTPKNRKDSLVHADFSTSTLMFKPNTYYTFVLELDFSNGGITPNWEAYVKYNPNATNHYLISLVRQDVPGSIWNMPKPIFDSSLAIKYNYNGFNMDGTVLSNQYEAAALFVDNDAMGREVTNNGVTSVVDKGKSQATVVKFIGCVKTNNFLKDNSALGMWSFLEGWVDDYWKAKMKISVFEDRIVENIPECYAQLYKYYSGNDYSPSAGRTRTGEYTYLNNQLSDMLPVDEIIAKTSNAIVVKNNIDKIIEDYYKNMRDFVVSFIKEENNSNNAAQTPVSLSQLKSDICDHILMTQSTYLPRFINVDDNGNPIMNGDNPTYINSEDDTNEEVVNKSKEISNLWNTAFPCIPFPYLEASFYTENSVKKVNSIIKYNYQENTFSDKYKDKIKRSYIKMGEILNNNTFNNFPLMDENILRPLKVSTTFDTIYIEYDVNGLNTTINFFGDNDVLLNTELDETINELIEIKKQEYWNKFVINELENEVLTPKNLLYKYIMTIYDISNNNIFNITTTGNETINFTLNNDKIREEVIEIMYRYGFIFLHSPHILQLCEILYKQLGYETTTNAAAQGRRFFYIVNLIGSYALNLQTNFIENSPDFEYYIFSFRPSISYNNGINLTDVIINNNIGKFNNSKVFTNKFIDTANDMKTFISNNSNFISDIIKNPSKAAIKIIGLDSNFIVATNYVAPLTYLKEQKICVFGAPDGPDWYAQDIILNRSTKNDLNTLTFSLYDNYYELNTGKKEKNPIIDFLKNESKIKLKYEGQWFDFIIKEQNLDNTAHKTTFIAKDAFVIELSKIGFNKTFNTELDNNIGTINDLSNAILSGTSWTLNQRESFYQSAQKAIFGGFLKDGYKIVIPNQEYYYDKDLNRVMNNTQITIIQNNSEKPEEQTFIYLFYDESLEEKTKPKLIIATWEQDSQEQYISQNSYQKIDNTLINVYICLEYKIYNGTTELTSLDLKEFNTNSSNFLTLKTIDIFKGDTLYFDYGLRVKDIVTKPIMHYSVPLKRYVTEYEKLDDLGNVIETLYGYSEETYTTKPLVQNLLPNGEDFTSLTGWINGSTNDMFAIRMGLDAATRNNDISTITPFLNFTTSVESGTNRLPHGFICNTDLSYNFAAVDHLTPGEDFVLRLQVERGNDLKSITTPKNLNDDQLILMETMRPYLYCYDGSAKLQSKNNPSVLPKAEQQVVSFIQDKRSLDAARLNSKIITQSTTGTNGSGMYSDKYVYDLSETMNKHGLVSLHWSNRAANNINDIPCAYIKKELAESWKTSGYLKHFDEAEIHSGKSGGSKNYYFTGSGWNNFRKLFQEGENSTFNLRDFAIIANIDASKCTLSNVYSMTNLFPSDTTEQMYYYLPMLFSDDDLIDEIARIEEIQINEDSNIAEEVESKTGISKNTLYNKFFQYSKWEEVLKTKEYYDVNSTGRAAGNLRAFPKNIDIDFDPKNSSEGSIAYRDTNDYPDFDLLMRMRMYWKVVRYSEANTCIFEAEGTFFGKPTLNSNNSYCYTTSAQLAPAAYTYQDLLSQHLGLFFTFDQTMYDNGGKGNSMINISKVELFRKFKDENDELILPNKTIDTNDSPIYRFYNPDNNIDAIKADDINYDYVGTVIPNNYKVKIDDTGERRNALTITESNCYNMLQKLAEIFDGWLELNVNHNNDGSLELDSKYQPIKTVSFVNTRYNDNYSGIKYGINLQKIQRKIDSNDIITKLIVKNNNNEYGQNGFCSIARSKLNLNGTNAILNFNHFVNMGLLQPDIIDILYNDIYPRTYAYGQFLANIIDERTKQGVIVSQLRANTEYYQLVVSNAKDKLSEKLDQYSALHLTYYSGGQYYDRPVGYYINDESARNKLTKTTKSIVDSIMFYNGIISGFSAKLSNILSDYNNAVQKYNLLIDTVTSVTAQRDSLFDDFYKLCQGYIREGAWSSEDYLDDDLYYLDAERQADEYAVPRVTYNIDVVDLSSLPGYEAYSFDLKDKTYIEDVEVFGVDGYAQTPVKEEIIVTEKTDYLNSPEKNVITVQNYKTHFGDLFQRITSTIQAVEFGTLNYTNKNSDNNLNTRLSNNEITLQALKQFNKI